MPPGRSVYCLRLVLVAPELLSVGCLQAQSTLFGPLPGKDIELVPHQRRRRIARADGGLPILNKSGRPFRRLGKPAHLAVTIWPPPPRPILCEDAGACGQKHATHYHSL